MSGRNEDGKGWILDAISTGGLSLIGGSPRPAAPAAEADLREQLRQELDDSVLMHTGRSVGDLASDRVVGELLAGPLRGLVEQAAEAARLREHLREVEAELRELASAALRSGKH